MPAAVEQALNDFDIEGFERDATRSAACSQIGTRGAVEKARLKRIRKQPKCFRPRAPIVPVRKPLDPDEKYLLEEREAIQG